MTKKIGYIVMEASEDFEQGLALIHGADLPEGGILAWRGNRGTVAVFDDKSKARRAIDRTEHYRLAFGDRQRPEKKLCKIVPIEKAQ